MDDTPNLSLPYIYAAQAQKHVTHNEAIRALDAIVQLAVVSRSLAAPPGSPADGERHIVAAGASGAWTGEAGRVAAFQDGAWAFYAAREGWIAWVGDENAAVVWDGTAWIGLAAGGGGGGSVNPTPLVGVNATADSTNRLSVASPATLLNHEGGGHQLKINKAAAANTAAVLFQTGFSGRAEFGLTGDDDWHVKVSADGTVWREAIVVDRSTGAVAFPNTAASSGGVNPSLLVNGDFQINQRAFAGGVRSAGVYGHDRWKAATGGANWSVAGYLVTLASGTVEQVIEPSVWGYANLASTQLTISVDAPSADLTVTVGAASGTITAGSGRRSVTLTTGAGDTGNIALKIARASSSGVTFGRVKLEAGASATGWEARPFNVELLICLRYYEKTYAAATAPGTATTAGQRSVSATAASTALIAPQNFLVPKRTTPTMVIYSPTTGGAAKYYSAHADLNIDVGSVTGLGAGGFTNIVSTGYINTIGHTCSFHFTADAEV